MTAAVLANNLWVLLCGLFVFMMTIAVGLLEVGELGERVAGSLVKTILITGLAVLVMAMVGCVLCSSSEGACSRVGIFTSDSSLPLHYYGVAALEPRLDQSLRRETSGLPVLLHISLVHCRNLSKRTLR